MLGKSPLNSHKNAYVRSNKRHWETGWLSNFSVHFVGKLTLKFKPFCPHWGAVARYADSSDPLKVISYLENKKAGGRPGGADVSAASGDAVK